MDYSETAALLAGHDEFAGQTLMTDCWNCGTWVSIGAHSHQGL